MENPPASLTPDFASELPTPTEFPDSQDTIEGTAKTWLQMLAISERPTRDIRRPRVSALAELEPASLASPAPGAAPCDVGGGS